MVLCPLCFCRFPTLSLLLTHIRLIHADDPNFRMQCNLQGCRQTFRKFTVFRNHVYQFHDQQGLSDEETPEVGTLPDDLRSNQEGEEGGFESEIEDYTQGI